MRQCLSCRVVEEFNIGAQIHEKRTIIIHLPPFYDLIDQSVIYRMETVSTYIKENISILPEAFLTFASKSCYPHFTNNKFKDMSLTMGAGVLMNKCMLC